ncbi:hypothetical protein LTR37_006638 [Vermiconidia calcicola]|uniref:Uncharacterized protein n=1 Tax=Vermiconidia calcicola TaxID=1690605 RepID=A0ACC3NHL4_9PEZI|nr:hypothetical protein LTR37_006638 [Vermiconidia calcicola]
MPDSPEYSLSSTPSIQSNKSFTAHTVPDTVMAEQISHNVVNNNGSASGSPLVDAVANTITHVSADDGAHQQPLPETKTDGLQMLQSTDQHATDINAITSSLAPGSQAADAAAEPSAGDAAGTVTETNTVDSEANTLDKSSDAPIHLTNGLGDATGSGDGVLDEGSVDASLHSDAEGSRGDASEQKKDEKHHTRTSSVKKPANFSKVSVTKNFLAKSATPTPTAVAKSGDKPSPAGTPLQLSAAKPRLIAKTGASLRDVQKARIGAESASGPDASKVWNKNRPVPPPPPKQFTDEELKQQYGIHLATRLQSDETGKESKWADIDDDEDDWAPETVVWMDGTKSTLTPQDAANLQKEQAAADPQPTKPAEGAKPSLAPKKPTELGPTKTILKPGLSAAAAQAKQNGLPAGASTDKSSQAKSPAATPSKSPWAALPPVEKVSPINPPVQQPPAPKFMSQDARAYEPATPSQPAREIAADTFDRSWREGEGGTRELFNSTNGRYEPAPEGRRTSVKPDSVRKPSVLQRPSQNAVGPAEPSSAFQTRTTSQADGYGRRRGSSINQDGVPAPRRMSVSKGPDLSPASERRPSTVVGHDMRTSPRVAKNEPAQPVFSQQSAWQQQMPPRPEQGTEGEVEAVEDPVKVQERVMREKRELAKKRRQEEEEQKEAEKQKRLKARLAGLEGAGKSRKEREAEAAAAAAATAVIPSAEKPPEVTTAALDSQDARPQPAQPAETAAMAAPALEAQSLPSAPEAPLVPSTMGPVEAVPSPIPPKPQSSSLPEGPTSTADHDQRQAPRHHLSPRANARAPFQQQPSTYRPPASSYSSPGDRKQQPFGRSPLQNNDAFSTPWPTTAPNGNVWGTSGIGNGTFESANGFAPMPMPQQTSSLPPPPGMTRPSPSARISPQGVAQESRSPSLQQQAAVEPQRGFAPPGFESRTDPFANQARANGTSPIPGLARPPHAPGPIAPPSRSQQQQSGQHSDKLKAWGAAAENLPRKYQSDAEAAVERSREAVSSAPRDDTIKETFKRTSAQQGRLGAPRKYDQTEFTVHDAQGSRPVQTLSPAPPNAQTQPSGPFSTASPLQQDPWKAAGERTVRIPDGSLNAAHGGLPAQQPPIGPPTAQHQVSSGPPGSLTAQDSPVPPSAATKDQSPPPPETSSHPVNSGNARQPLVKLPPGRPVVKLPPAPSPAPPQSPLLSQNSVLLPQRPISNWGAPKPLAMQPSWQERFNGLFNRTAISTEVPPSPPKTPPKAPSAALAVTSSSRTVMDDAPAAEATVSLPQAKRVTSSEGFIIDDSADIISKPRIEQMFTEELNFGSTPKVALPRGLIYNKILSPTPRNMMNTAPDSRIEIRSSLELNMTDIHPQKYVGIFVHLPQLKLNNRMAKRNTTSHQPGGYQDRKPSGKFNKQRGAGASPSTVGASSNSSRQPSFQKPAAPAPGPQAAAGNHATETARKPSATRGGFAGHRGGRGQHGPQQTVKPVQ